MRRLADESQLRQVVWNLATNGLRAMPGGGTLNLVVQASAESPDDAGQVTLEVRDEGVGIPADQLEEILHPFRGGFSKGTGLGLSIVHRIVSDYGGELLVTSQEGSGSTVTVKLPTLPPGGRTPVPDQWVSAARRVPHARTRGRRRRTSPVGARRLRPARQSSRGRRSPTR